MMLFSLFYYSKRTSGIGRGMRGGIYVTRVEQSKASHQKIMSSTRNMAFSFASRGYLHSMNPWKKYQ